MAGERFKLREFMNDVLSGTDHLSLMGKYGLTENDLVRLFRRLNEEDMAPLVRLLREEKLSESQISRAFRDIEDDIHEKKR